MLYRALIIGLGVMGLGGPAVAQVLLDRGIRFIGADAERGVDGIAPPTERTQLITVGTAVRGMATWAEASLNGDTISLTTPIPSDGGQTDIMLHFNAPQEVSGRVFLRLNGSAPEPLLRPDGLSPLAGQIRAGSICEIMMRAAGPLLLAPGRRGCPPRTVAINDQVCVDSTVVTGLGFYEAASHCSEHGGRLCTWDEFYTGCSRFSDQLAELNVAWEWVDDTANHTHTIGQVGALTCMSQRTTAILPTVTGSTRCCYHVR